MDRQKCFSDTETTICDDEIDNDNGVHANADDGCDDDDTWYSYFS